MNLGRVKDYTAAPFTRVFLNLDKFEGILHMGFLSLSSVFQKRATVKKKKKKLKMEEPLHMVVSLEMNDQLIHCLAKSTKTTMLTLGNLRVVAVSCGSRVSE